MATLRLFQANAPLYSKFIIHLYFSLFGFLVVNRIASCKRVATLRVLTMLKLFFCLYLILQPYILHVDE